MEKCPLLYKSGQAHLWILREERMPKQTEPVRARIFTHGNGIIGSPTAVPLSPRGQPGILLGGLYGEGPADLHWIPKMGHPARDNIKYPLDEIIRRKHTLQALAMGPDLFALNIRRRDRRQLSHGSWQRRLDMSRGVMLCRGLIPLRKGGFMIRSRRVVSWANRNLVVERVKMRSSAPLRLEVDFLLDASRKNLGVYDLWRSREVKVHQGMVTYSAVSKGVGEGLGVAMQVVCDQAKPTLVLLSNEVLVARFTIALDPNKPVIFDRFVGVASTVQDSTPLRVARKACKEGVEAGFVACEEAHALQMAEFWRQHDIEITGGHEDQRAVRYAIYQMGCGRPPDMKKYSFGAKFLSGEWYRGCLFWDTDMYVAPYFTKREPEVARQHILHRKQGLPAAKKLAKASGFKGAKYPWEAYPSGEDATPPWLVYGETQVHVIADVAWNVSDYCLWTDDKEIREGAGAEILKETAEFWASRVEETQRGTELHNVCGPDEYHMKVNNSVYLNALVQANLRAAAECPGTSTKKKEWKRLAEAMFFPPATPRGVLPEFEGFFNLPEAPPATVEPQAPRFRLVKQADVMMLPLIFPKYFDVDTVSANYEFYEPRTTHLSSLSHGVHALVAATIGRLKEAYKMFKLASHTDLHNLQRNGEKGLHAASLAMTPRVVMEGFVGLKIVNDKPVAQPHLPEKWVKVSFPFVFRGQRYRCTVDKGMNGTTVPCEKEESQPIAPIIVPDTNADVSDEDDDQA